MSCRRCRRDRKHHARGLCESCYRNLKTAGGLATYQLTQQTMPAKGMTCSVDGCDKDVHSLGLCPMHRYRMRRHGDPAISLAQPRTNPLIRILARVEVDAAGCWIWPGATNSRGYGWIIVGKDARQWPKRTSARTHRVTYEHYFGPIPDGLVIDHLCRVTRCCNPDHLEAVTQGENIRRGWQHRAKKVA